MNSFELLILLWKGSLIVGLLGTLIVLWQMSKHREVVVFGKFLLKFSLRMGIPSGVIATLGMWWLGGDQLGSMPVYETIGAVVTVLALSTGFVSVGLFAIALLILVCGIGRNKLLLK